MNDAQRPPPSRRDLEVVLRQAGLSHRQARKLLAAGYRSIADGDDADAGGDEVLAALEHVGCLIRARR